MQRDCNPCAASVAFVEGDDEESDGNSYRGGGVSGRPFVGIEPDTEMAPLVSAEQLERMSSHLDSGEREGLRTVARGRQIAHRGWFVAPTVIEEAGPGNKSTTRRSSARS